MDAHLKKLIQHYATQAQALDMPAAQRQTLAAQVIGHCESFLERLSTTNAYHVPTPTPPELSDIHAFQSPWGMTEILAFIEQHVSANGISPTSPRSMAYFPNGGLYPAALADFIAAVTNLYATMHSMAPAAVEMENLVIQWMCELIGYPKSAAGVLTSGGSMANLIALHAARENANIKAENFARLVIYTSEQTHHSINKSLGILGLKEAIVRRIATDSQFRLMPSQLERAIQQDLADHYIPWVIVASAGTTSTGAIDPLDKIASIAAHHQLWLHVDAAYGGFFTLTQKGQHLLKALNQADSITLDPHKSLFIPYGLGTLIVKERSTLLQAYRSHDISYLADFETPEHLSPADLSPELSRNFRALRLWLPLKLLGLAPFKAALEEKLLLAQYFYQQIQTIPGIEVACKPELSVVNFRYVPTHYSADPFNLLLLQALLKDGRILISSTQLNNKVFLRLAVLNFRTHLPDIELAISLITQKISECISTFEHIA